MSIKATSFVTSLVCLVAISCVSEKSNTTISAYEVNAKSQDLQPGDTLRITEGFYEDVVLDISSQGTKDNPVVICANTPGKVVFTGKSSLNVSGQYIVISDLHFDAGYSEKSVISFRAKNGSTLARNTRITNCAITNYSNPDRIHSDHWIEIFGRENRFDHNHIGTKWNLGATMVMRLGDSISTDNQNSIDSNFFGAKPRLGSNGGETLRIGSSANSLKKGGAYVIGNYFDRCSGEVEVLSIKSSENHISNNIFFECEGVLALRHGNKNYIGNNTFIGNRKSETGGLRVINAGHVIENNLFYGITGKRFFAALAVMNGVPNSAINRYHQVADVQLLNNRWVDCDRISFSVGADNERTAAPVRTIFSGNTILYRDPSKEPFFFDTSASITFKDNKTNSEQNLKGFTSTTYKELEQAYIDSIIAVSEDVGPKWLNRLDLEEVSVRSNKRIAVDESNIEEALDNLTGGDTLVFSAQLKYSLSKPLRVRHDVTFTTEGEGYALIQPGAGFKGALIQIENGVNVYMDGIWLSGRNGVHNSPYGLQAKAPMLQHYNLFIDDCRFSDFKESRYAAIHAEKGTFADTIVIADSWFKDFSGYGIALNSENDDRGRYNAEYITVSNCQFVDMMGSAIDIYRGGNDESTLGPFVTINDCNFVNICNRELGTAVRMIGVQWSRIYDCKFVDSGKSGRAIWFEDPAWADVEIKDIGLSNSGRLQTFYPHRVDRGSLDYSPINFDGNLLKEWSL
ncbi:polysaccharide lyase 6 family protein [bacterium]|nr:polysaccharide lyase 6 family protein [bacterium]